MAGADFGGEYQLKMWAAFAFAGVIAMGYLLFFVLDSLEGQGANALGLANIVGLVTVGVGLFMAAAVLRRTTRP